jgi:hypothetical protein
VKPDADGLGESLGFSALEDQPIRYIDRTHAWYDRIGTANHYRYASFEHVPFQPLKRPLREGTVALVTTAAPYQPDKGPQDSQAPYNASAKFYEVYSEGTGQDPDVRVSHVGVNRRELTDDMDSWFPLRALRRAAMAGRIGRLAPRFHGMPTNRSQRHTLVVDSPELLERCRVDRVDAVVLVANCPVCHQTLSLAARHLEAAGIATVLMGAAKDIVERCGVPRFLFSDFPLGSAAARPHDPSSQDAMLGMALDLLEHAFAPRTTVQNPLRWHGRADWKHHVLNAAALTEEQLQKLRADFTANKQTAHQVRDATLGRAS